MHWFHRFQGKGQYICSSDKLCLKDSQSLQHTQVYILHKDLQNILVCTGRQLHHFYENNEHSDHKGMVGMDQQVSWLLFVLKEKH